jgi:hypothetical protein
MRPAARDVAFAALGGVASPALVTPYLLALGYRLDGPPVSVLLPLAALGVTVALALARGLRAAPLLAGVAVVVLPPAPLFGGPPPAPVVQFAADALFAFVCVLLAAIAEYAVRQPAVVGRVLPPSVRPAAAAGGVLYTALAVGVRFALGLGWYTAGPLFLLIVTGWSLLGTVLLGVTVAVAFARYRLVTPALVVFGVTAVAVYDAWQFAVSPAAGAGPTLLALVFAGWFAPLAGALLVGAVEYRLRAAFVAHSGT